MKNNNFKTNVMRILDQHKIDYKTHCYVDTNAISGLEVASVLNEDPNRTFKTLVTVSNTKNYYVFMISVNHELDLKKCANAVNEKNIEMIKSSELLNLTGYIHGGCSPIGMKKQFKTVIDINASNYETIIFSAGKIGYQVELSLNDLKKIINFDLKDIKK